MQLREDHVARRANRVLVYDTNAFATYLWHRRCVGNGLPGRPLLSSQAPQSASLRTVPQQQTHPPQMHRQESLLSTTPNAQFKLSWNDSPSPSKLGRLMNTYVLGDHHTNHDDLLRAMVRNGWKDARIIHVGDGEEGYPGRWNEETAERLDKSFAALGIEYLSIRGNHSNPRVFDGSIMLPNFKLLPDYSQLEINGESWLFVGGAVSINRIEREEGKTWWVEEEMVLREDLALPADVLVTHAGPSWLSPPSSPLVEGFIRSEEAIGCSSLRQELADEQLRHDRLFEIVKPRHWYYGHYHHRADHLHEGCNIKQLGLADVTLHVSGKMGG